MGRQGRDLVGIVPPDLTIGIEGTSAVEVEIVPGKEPKRGTNMVRAWARIGGSWYIRVLVLHIVGIG